jgi:hypothetical protein
MTNWRIFAMKNDFMITLPTNESDKIIENCSMIAEHRFNEYYARNPFTSISKIRNDFIVGLVCEQAFYKMISPFLMEIGCSITEPDTEFHANNLHGYDFIVNGNIPVSVKGSDREYDGERSWVYQPDKLRIDEDVHVFMYVHKPNQNYEKGEPVMVEWAHTLTGEKVMPLLKPPLKPMGNKMAIYESDIIGEIQ